MSVEYNDCENCGGIYPIVLEENHEWGYQVRRTVAFIANPYMSEIHQDYERHWLCSFCAYDSSMDI